MKNTLAGIIIGLLLTIIMIMGGAGWLIAGLILAAVGGVIGLQLDGVIDVRKIVEGTGRAR